jgi:organic radical activating enzyme
MTFVRLAGCSVRGCLIREECDTDWRHGRALHIEDIVQRVQAFGCSTVSLTGGEPTDHNLAPLLAALAGNAVHLETSGVRAAPCVQWLTVSPKRFDYVQRTGDALKVIVRPEWSWSEVDQLSAKTSFDHYYLQPLTVAEQPVNLSQVLRMVQERPQWMLSTQAHRLWRVR